MATDIDRITRIEIRLALEDLNGDFCRHLDHGNIDALVDLFTGDALYTHGKRVTRGTPEIRRLFEQRSAGALRTSRHMQTGLSIDIKSENRAEGRSVCMTFAKDAPAPVTPAIPFLVADFTDAYLLCPDGRWRIEERRIDRIFTDPDNRNPVGLAPVTPQKEETR